MCGARDLGLSTFAKPRAVTEVLFARPISCRFPGQHHTGRKGTSELPRCLRSNSIDLVDVDRDIGIHVAVIESQFLCSLESHQWPTHRGKSQGYFVHEA